MKFRTMALASVAFVAFASPAVAQTTAPAEAYAHPRLQFSVRQVR